MHNPGTTAACLLGVLLLLLQVGNVAGGPWVLVAGVSLGAAESDVGRGDGGGVDVGGV